MKNQLDTIIMIAALVVALVTAGIFYGTKRAPLPAMQVTPTDVRPVSLPSGGVVMANAPSSGRGAASSATAGSASTGSRGGRGGGRGGG
ncbi:MAG: hypothetical protein HYR64_09925 [Fimbriimonas ginsengisoli]|uniref:Uncharacterized protein n=1 Tax=Fimbriimonas ginsengisoli TaxID=1005039 RepID=A0A931PWJ8_FIMGI|nr:hypothetical protein [Fimbriimonas ginsengisoli]